MKGCCCFLGRFFLMTILFVFCSVTNSYGWGAAKDRAPTHNQIVSLAFDYLEKDPGFNSSLFPGKNRTLQNDWVTFSIDGLTVVGPGPDGEGNSRYSSHYYNPIIADGGGPGAISEQLENLLKALMGLATTDSIGKSAAWSAHYLADMNVPYHVVGTSWKTAFDRKGSSVLDSATVKFTPQETGPHELYTLPGRLLPLTGPRIGWGADNDFKIAVETFFFFNTPGSSVDWFDPWYLNGNVDLPSVLARSLAGSHAIWEYWAAKSVPDHEIRKQLETITSKEKPYDPRWKNKRAKWGDKFHEPVLIAAEQYAQAVALGTRGIILKIWENPVIGIANAVWAVSTMYRGAMTSLESAVSVRTPSPGVHEVIVRLTNGSDINSHSNIDVKFSLNDGGSVVQRYKGKIGPNSSGELKLQIENSSLTHIKGKIEVRSDSDKCPDLGYSLEHINVSVDNTGAKAQPEMVVVPKLIGMKKDKALEIIKEPDFYPVPVSSGPAPSENLSYLIFHQKPEPNSTVTKGTSVEFRHYDKWTPTETPPDEDGTDKNEKIPQEQDLTEANNDTDIGPEECSGGLIIVGPTKIVFDQGISYSACDREGKPYPPGNISWSYSDESIVSLYTSGNPVTGVGFKAGTFVIMARCGSYVAYLDVEIKDKKSNLFSTSGGEDSETAQGNLFATTGGETITGDTDINCDHIPGSTAVQGECICTGGLILSPSRRRCVSCDEYYQAVESAFNDQAFGAAQAIVNEAGECAWAGRIQGLINKAELGQVCNTISANLQAACQANNAKAAHGFMGEAGQNNCNIDPGLWQWGTSIINAYNQQIKDQRAAQNPQPSQSQTNWMDVMNAVVKGMQGVQQMNDPKPSSGPGSRPSPGNNSSSFPTRTYNGMDPGVVSSLPGAGSVSGSTNTIKQNNCGRKISKQELAGLKQSYGRMVKQWRHVQGWYDNFRISAGVGNYLNYDRYQKNVETWKKKVNCWNGCANAAPKSGAKSADSKRFYDCRQNCFKNHKYDNT